MLAFKKFNIAVDSIIARESVSCIPGRTYSTARTDVIPRSDISLVSLELLQ